MSGISIIILNLDILIIIPLTIHKWLPLLGYCGVQYSECSASDSMSINVAETGDESEIGSNCAEDWIEIEGMSSKRSSLFSLCPSVFSSYKVNTIFITCINFS